MAADRDYENPLLSVPFSSGHRLLLLDFDVETLINSNFQSPFHRGIGCYLRHKESGRRGIISFSPLFIGA